MICKNCGKELTSEDRFCSRCGSKVEALVEEAFEEVVFNPPFKIENEMREAEKKAAELGGQEAEEKVEEARKRRFDTIDFTWDLSGFPSDKESKNSAEEIVFDWTAKAKEAPAKEEVQSETELEVETDVEETPVLAEEEPVSEIEQEVIENFENVEASAKEPSVIETQAHQSADEQMQEYLDDGMPQGNGISVEDFLEELKNHVPKEERIKEEEPEVVPEPQNFQEKLEQGRKGLKSFFRGAFLEPSEEKEDAEQFTPQESEETPSEIEALESEIEEVEETQEVPSVQEPVVQPVEVVAIDPCCVSPITVEAPQPEKTEEDEIENLKNQEINEFLPEDKQETGDSAPSPDATRIVDKFYTFNKKNVEFQKLLDQEYDKIRGERPLEDVKAEVKQSNKAASDLAKEVLEKKEELAQDSKAGKEKLNWDEIFGDLEDIEEKPEKKGGAGKFFGVLLLIIVLALGGAYGVMKLMPDTQAANFIEQYYDKGLEILGIENNNEPIEEETIQTYIDKQIDNNRHIGEIYYSEVLDVSQDLLSRTEAFKNEDFVKINGNETNYGEMLAAALISHYSAESGKDETITKLVIGNFRTDDKVFYVPCEYTESEGTVKEIIALSLKGDNIVIDNIEKI